MKHIVVIGGGPAGYPAALKASSLGAKVTLVEKNKVGGVCLNCGCIPSKSLLDAAHRFHTVKTISALCADGAQEQVDKLFNLLDWKKIQARQRAATRKLTQGVSFLLKKAGVEVINGEASFVNEHTISVKKADGTEQQLEADGVILATGSEAFFPPPFDQIKDKIYDNSTLFDMPHLPKELVIVGGGVIGCEMADFMNELGVKVSIVEMQPRLLPLEDEGAARVLTQAFGKRGIQIFTGVSAEGITCENGTYTLTLSNGQTVTADAVLAAIGRSVNLSALKMENIGVTWNRKGIQVNPQTLQLKGNIYAAGIIAEIGDINRFPSQASLAKYAGLVWTQHQSSDFEAEDKRMIQGGNHHLKYYLCEAANALRRCDSEFKRFYALKYKEANKHNHKRALALTARKLVRLVYTLLKTNRLYIPPEEY